MIAVRAPLRVSLGGGGTDLPSYFGDEEGFVLSAAIDKHVWLLVSTAFNEGIRLKHLAWEEVSDAASVEHPILRVALGEHWNGAPLELASMADVPAGTGLGSSGAYAVAAVRALAGLEGVELAESACRLEIDLLGRTVGKQDQYAAVYGGVNALTFRPDSVDVRRVDLPPESAEALRGAVSPLLHGRLALGLPGAQRPGQPHPGRRPRRPRQPPPHRRPRPRDLRRARSRRPPRLRRADEPAPGRPSAPAPPRWSPSPSPTSATSP